MKINESRVVLKWRDAKIGLLIFRSHRMHCIDAAYCYMSHVELPASLYRVSCAKTAEPIEMPFGWLTQVGLRNHALDGVEIPDGKGQSLGLSGPLKSTGNL